MSYRAIFLLATVAMLSAGLLRAALTEPHTALERWPQFALLAGILLAGWFLVPKGRLNVRFSAIAAGIGTLAFLFAAVRRPLILLPYIPVLVAAALTAYILKPPRKN